MSGRNSTRTRRETTARRSTQRLLVVDFDYFFPNPNLMSDPPLGDIFLYDWKQGETDEGVDFSLLFGPDVLWNTRAETFYSQDRALPTVQGWEGFWGRFSGLERVPLIYTDSNLFAAPQYLLPYDERRWDVIDLYDAHHDCGYRDGEDHVHCGNWLREHRLFGTSDLRVHYPAWRQTVKGTEVAPIIDVDRSLDDGLPVDSRYRAVFVCRSGSWVPAWCDGQFEQFLAAYPGPVSVSPDGGLPVQRPMDLDGCRERSVLFKVMRRDGGARQLAELQQLAASGGELPQVDDPVLAAALKLTLPHIGKRESAQS